MSKNIKITLGLGIGLLAILGFMYGPKYDYLHPTSDGAVNLELLRTVAHSFDLEPAL